MCTATQIKNIHPKPTDTSSKNSSSQSALLTITHPLIPSREGNPTHHNPLIFNKKATFPISPLERGRGCVTSAHRHSNQKQPLKANRYFCATLNTRNTTSPNSSKIISNQSAHLTVTHPFIPSQEGNSTHHTPLISNKKATFPISPLERGWGCVTYAHSHPNQKHPPEAKKHLLKKLLKPAIRTSKKATK